MNHSNSSLPLVQNRLDGPLLKLVADPLGLIFAINGEAVLLGFVGANLHLQLTTILWFKVVLFLLNWEGEDVDKLLAVDDGLANLDLNL